MEIINKIIKEDARRNLKGQWIITVLCTLLCGNLNIAFNLIPAEFHIGTLMLVLLILSVIIFTFGYNNILLQISRGKKVEFSEFLSGYTMSLKSFGMLLVIWIYTFLWSLLFFIPGIIARIKYSMAPFIWVDNPDKGINEIIEESINLTKGHKGEIFLLYLSFIGWYALLAIPFFLIIHYIGFSNSDALIRNCVITIVSIGYLYLCSYVRVSMGVLYNKLIEIGK